MNKMKPLRLYQIVIVVSCIILSWGFANIALFTQHEFREWINWGNRYDYETDWGQKIPAPEREETEIKDVDGSKEQKIEVSWEYNFHKWKSQASDTLGNVFQNKKSIFATIIIIIILILVLIFRYIQKRKRKKEVEVKPKLNLVKQIEEEELTQEESKAETVVVFNEIRQELIKWEKQLYQHKKRKPYETVQQWFQRIGKSPHILPIYEKVRYGEKEYSVEELKMIKHWVKE
ncbi:hypothetical protein [Bacillus manliponensis]|uniref:hypothetical protein n=1 Tax=Bacillus manliponensis TaxID=574376 RepID=UPI003514AB49